MTEEKMYKATKRELSVAEKKLLQSVANKITSEYLHHKFSFQPFEQGKNRPSGTPREFWMSETPEEYGDLGVFGNIIRSYHLYASAWVYDILDGDDTGKTLINMDFNIQYKHHGGGSNGYEISFTASMTVPSWLQDPTYDLAKSWGEVDIKINHREGYDRIRVHEMGL
jgi:hypothetical protein